MQLQHICLSMRAILSDVSLLAFLSSLPRCHWRMAAIVSPIINRGFSECK